MKGALKASFGFTKLIVDDEEAMAEYYHQVYGLEKLQRVQEENSDTIGPIREIIMGRSDGSQGETLVMFKFVDRPAPRDQEAILGFISEDLDALAERVTANGGKLIGAIKSMPDHGVRVVFTTDPEGRLSENVEMIAA
jgi:predicted enzyme related to lactoylglutathione lyase